MGNPKFAINPLKSLLASNHDIVAVISNPPKPMGRKKKLQHTDVGKFSLDNNLNLIELDDFDNLDIFQKISSLKVDIFVVVAFRILPKKYIELPKFGSINIHASLLPKYRGAAPINLAIINNEKYTGVTTFYINENIDSGDILLQKKVEISENETAGTLHDKLSFEGSRLLCETIDRLSKNKITAKPQKLLDDIKLAPKINAENSHLNLGKKIDEIKSTIRGLSPSPGAWVTLKSKKTSIVMKII